MQIESVFEGRSSTGISLKLSLFCGAMDYTNPDYLLDTSLNLTAKPLRVFDDDSKHDTGVDFIEFGRKIPLKEEKVSDLQAELNRVNDENKNLTEMLTVMSENYNALRNQLMEYTSKNGETDSNGSKKRKGENIVDKNENVGNRDGGIGACDRSSSSDEDSCKKPKIEHIKAKISKAYVRTEASDISLIVKDGYQWRKYGQKVTKDNPFPRAYFKCSFAPTCPVKKKVQRDVEDQCILVATYEGEHNHLQLSNLDQATSSNTTPSHVTLGSSLVSQTSSGPTTITTTLDLTKTTNFNDDQQKTPEPRIIDSTDHHQMQKSLVEQMASSLTNDSKFRAALAAAISGRILHPNQ